METILFEASGGVGRLTLNRPDRLNGMTNQMLIETHDCLIDVARRDDVRVLLLTGAGRGFCPGADLKHYAAGEADVASEPRHFQVPVLLHGMPQITIAAINGPCAGAGLGWACGCDLRIAARSANFNTAFLKVASAGDMGGPWSLPRLIGAAKARELYFLAEKFGAEEALAMGLVSRVFEDEHFAEEAEAMAEALAASSPHALRTMKQNFLDAERLSFTEYVELETDRHLEVMAHPDAREAFQAFVEKRPPRFESSK
ncbi:MAG: enoyl-CoA hydratase/isomerase family protein [Pseudomonadales bacterium]|nr:enoyl-CoA hydratase/isomerase family protein [Pseudomonadales bacterium]NIX09197.1 enoyl-CoA hydratase/isomerase family protein [Pseudomonadales bacterium]